MRDYLLEHMWPYLPMTQKNIPCITAHWEFILDFFTDKFIVNS